MCWETVWTPMLTTPPRGLGRPGVQRTSELLGEAPPFENTSDSIRVVLKKHCWIWTLPPKKEPSEDLRAIVDLHEGGKDSERISESLDVHVSTTNLQQEEPLKNRGCGRTPHRTPLLHIWKSTWMFHSTSGKMFCWCGTETEALGRSPQGLCRG